MRFLALTITSLLLFSCSRDPNYLKQKYVQSGNHYFDAGRYKEASIMYRKAIEADRKFGAAYYHLALTDLKQGQVANAVPALRRAHELLSPGTPEADDTDLKLAEIMVVAAQAQENREPLVKDVQDLIDGLMKRNPNGWQGHKLTGDLDMIAVSSLFREGKGVDAKHKLTEAVSEYRKALAVKANDPVITLALGRTLVLDGEAAEGESLFKGMIERQKNNSSAYLELYRIYLAQQKFADAESVLKNAIQNNPKETQLRLTLAQFYFATNKRPELISLLNQMKADLKQFPEAYFQAGDFFARVGQYDEAVAQYEEGIQKDPKQKNNYLKHETEAYIRQGKSQAAYEKNEEILKSDPKDPEARELRATGLLDKGDVNNAMAELQSVVTAKPNNFVARFNLGRAHFARGEYEQARQEFDAAISLRPDYVPARLAQTQIALLRGDNDAALRDANEILRIAPGSVQGRVMKAAALQRVQKFDEARGLLNEILAKNPKQVDTLLEMGVLDLNTHKIADAEAEFHKAYESDPNNLRGLIGESRAYFMAGQGDKAVQMIEAEAQKNPTRLDVQRELGNAQSAAGHYDDAISTFQAVMAKTSNQRQQADIWERIGEAYQRKGDMQKAIEAWEKARQGLPENAAITNNLAMLYEMQSKKETARKYYEMSIKLDPTNPLALNNLAYLISETNGDLELALTYANRAKQKLPNHPEVNDTLGWIYLKKNLTDNAIDTFRSLVVQVPQSPTYHYHYAMALMQKGDREAARKECQTALADKPRKDEQQQIQQLMARLG